MTAAKPVTKTNPQQTNFFWGKTELIKYKSRWGLELQGSLIYPANYDPAKKYPMITYIYERLSDEINSYEYPIDWNAYGVQNFSQNGYFVFKPDIAYHGNRPGESAVDCLEPAVDAAVKAQKSIDAKKIGLIGHSWGGYQTAFVTTVSDRFAIGVAGAPLTELTSMYNSYFWNAGFTDQVLFETSQGRMRVPFWEDPKAYFDNSPVWQSAKRKTPILMAFGDNDGAVDWHQGQYLYNTLRRMGKPCVMLVYAGENHNLRQRPNQLDYARRVRHWLDVYLKGEKPETWITEGIPFIKQSDK
jgi:dipeptidyl aminopeptidase/acylaminoacyl peptidase